MVSESFAALTKHFSDQRLLLTKFAIAIVVFVIFISTSFHSVGGNSDGATVVLEGQSLAHGHLLLHGWILSQDSFWTVDALFYGLFVLIFGIHGWLIHLVPACIATMIVLLAWHLGTTRNGGSSKNIALVIVTLGLVFPVTAWAQFFLAGPYHLGTTLYCLAAFALVIRVQRPIRYLCASLLLCAGILGDLQTLSLGVLPIAVAGIVAMLRTWNVRAGIGRILVALSAGILAFGIRKIAAALGAFTFAPPRTPNNLSLSLSNVIPGLHYAANMLGAGTGPFGTSPIPTALNFAHFAEVLLVALSALFALFQMFRGLVIQPPQDDDRHWELDDLLVIGVLGSLSTYAYLATTGSDAEARYLSAGLIFAVILCARLFSRPYRLTSTLRRPLVGIGALLSLAIVAGGGYTIAETSPPQQIIALIALLKSHHLSDGLGGYWSASISTVLSDNAIRVRPVITGPTGSIERYARQSLDVWYESPSTNFLVYNANVNVDAITRASARHTFGPAKDVYAVGPYRVLVYGHPIHVGLNGYAA
ncbi:MAG TPA: hypothetical protein VNE42_01710 [Acidimicrobiales bacterium]|nr:hypothetical protein [Acidimicrobiales bacterium]